jgi:hypothetical protein
MTKVNPAPGSPLTRDEFVQWVEQHFRMMCTGLVICNPLLPPEIMGEVIAEAMGRCLGAMTVSTDQDKTIGLRWKLSGLFKRSVRDAYPANQPPKHVHAPAEGTH